MVHKLIHVLIMYRNTINNVLTQIHGVKSNHEVNLNIYLQDLNAYY